MAPSPDDPIEQPGPPGAPSAPDAAAPTIGPDAAPDAAPEHGPADAPADDRAPTIGWTTPTPPAASPLLSSDPGAPLVGWRRPDETPAETPVADHVMTGPWARLVAWFIDSLIVSLPTTMLTIVVFDYGSMFRQMAEQLERDPGVAPTFSLPITPAFVGLLVVTMAIHFLYFVGFWTSTGGATPGMRLLAMRVVDTHSGRPIEVAQAAKRWLGLGMWISLLALLPPLMSVAGVAQFGLQFILFLTVATDRRRQGIHDRYAGTIVVRRASSRDGAVAMGCVVLVALAIATAVVIWSLFAALVLPEIQDIMDDLRTRT